jgi:hypothetical protein
VPTIGPAPPGAEAAQGFARLTATVVFRSDVWLQHRMLDSAREAGVLPSWCQAGARICRVELIELIAATGRSGQSWLEDLDTGSGPMACAQLMACAPDSIGAEQLTAAIGRDPQLQYEVVLALAELSAALAHPLASAHRLPVDEVLHAVIENIDNSNSTLIQQWGR